MPPRTVKRGAAAAGPKRTGRASSARGAAKGQNLQPEAIQEVPKTEGRFAINENPFLEEKQLLDNKPISEENRVVEDEIGAKSDTSGSASLKSK